MLQRPKGQVLANVTEFSLSGEVGAAPEAPPGSGSSKSGRNVGIGVGVAAAVVILGAPDTRHGTAGITAQTAASLPVAESQAPGL